MELNILNDQGQKAGAVSVVDTVFGTDFNAEHGIVPRGVVKQVRELIDGVYDLSGIAFAVALPAAGVDQPAGRELEGGWRAVARHGMGGQSRMHPAISRR